MKGINSYYYEMLLDEKENRWVILREEESYLVEEEAENEIIKEFTCNSIEDIKELKNSDFYNISELSIEKRFFTRKEYATVRYTYCLDGIDINERDFKKRNFKFRIRKNKITNDYSIHKWLSRLPADTFIELAKARNWGNIILGVDK